MKYNSNAVIHIKLRLDINIYWVNIHRNSNIPILKNYVQ